MESYEIFQLYNYNKQENNYKITIKNDIEINQCNPLKCIKCIIKIFSEHTEKKFIEISCIQRFNLSNEEIYLFTLLNKLNLKVQRLFHKRKIPFTQNFFGNQSNADNYDELSILDIFSNNNINSIYKEIKNYNERTKFFNFKLKSIKKSSLKRKILQIIHNSEISHYLQKNYAIFNPNIEKLLQFFPSFKNYNQKTKVAHNQKSNLLIKESLLFKESYLVKIYKNEQSEVFFYEIEQNLSADLKKQIQKYSNLVEKKIDFSFLKLEYNIAKRIDFVSEKFKNILLGFFQDANTTELDKLAKILALKFLHIEKIFVFLQDPNIEEIFLDEKEANIYFNHQRYGRLESKISLDIKEIEAIKTYMCLEGKNPLDAKHSSITHVFNNPYFHARFCIDIYPSHWKDIAIDIRNLKKENLTFKDLVEFKTLNADIIKFFLFLLFFKVNITIAGEVNSGKTTLMNAVDLCVPNKYRKIYLEENIETLEISDSNIHQLKYKVEPEMARNTNKEEEIYKLLHRSGDFIILGEILSKNETKALFHCLSAGLKGLQTTHASSLQGLLNRWTIHYDINPSCLNDLGVVVLMKKWKNIRRIDSISQIHYDSSQKKIDVFRLIEYDVKKKGWEINWERKEIPLIQDFLKIVPNYFDLYKKLVEFFDNSFLMNNEIIKYEMSEEMKIYNEIFRELNSLV